MANVRPDERAFRRLDKFANKKDDWKEWRTPIPDGGPRVRHGIRHIPDRLREGRRPDQGHEPDTDTAATVGHVAGETDQCHCQGGLRHRECDGKGKASKPGDNCARGSTLRPTPGSPFS